MIANNGQNQINQEEGIVEQASNVMLKKVALVFFSVPMILLNISLNAIQSIGRLAVQIPVNVFVNFKLGANLFLESILFPMYFIDESTMLLQLLNRLINAFIGIILAVACASLPTVIEILKTPILLFVSAVFWIYNAFVGFTRLFRRVGKNDIFVSNRYQFLDYDEAKEEELSVIKAIIQTMTRMYICADEKVQTIDLTQATLGYTLGFYDVKEKDELVEVEKQTTLIYEEEEKRLEYMVKPKLFPYRTGGFMVY